MAASDITAERVRELLHYDPETGIFTRRTSPAYRWKIGSIAGTINKRGYIRIEINSQSYAAHRLAWLFTYGQWPSEEIDHIDGNKLNNRIANLRDVSRKTNAQNIRLAQSNNQLGVLGVCWSPRHRKFAAHIRVDMTLRCLGYFHTAEAAQAAYLAAKRELHPGFVE